MLINTLSPAEELSIYREQLMQATGIPSEFIIPMQMQPSSDMIYYHLEWKRLPRFEVDDFFLY